MTVDSRKYGSRGQTDGTQYRPVNDRKAFRPERDERSGREQNKRQAEAQKQRGQIIILKLGIILALRVEIELEPERICYGVAEFLRFFLRRVQNDEIHQSVDVKINARVFDKFLVYRHENRKVEVALPVERIEIGAAGVLL